MIAIVVIVITIWLGTLHYSVVFMNKTWNLRCAARRIVTMLGVSDFALPDQASSIIQPCGDTNEFSNCLNSPPASKWILSRTRRCIEFVFAAIVLMILALPMLAAGLCIRLASPGPALFSQERVGMHGRRFRIYKLRSMAAPVSSSFGPGLTCAGDRRVTRVGRFLRRFKIDEVPQFYNILRGEMSLVGPRPYLPQYATIPNMSYRPGISSPATIAFRYEEEIFRRVPAAELDAFYAKKIKPVKARLDGCYMCTATPLSDLCVIAETLIGCIRPGGSPAHILKITETEPTRVLASEKPESSC